MHIYQEIDSPFNKATKELLQLLGSLTEDELNKLPFEGSWTAGQLGEHLLKSYSVAEVLNGTVKPTKRPVDQKVEGVKALFLDFNIKMDSPQAIVPSTNHVEKDKLLHKLDERIDTLQKIIHKKDLSMTCIDYAIPEYGNFTRLEWMWFNTFHTQRHVYQLKNMIKKLKAD